MTVSNTADMMSPLALFLSADIVVKIVMLGLLAASVASMAFAFWQHRRAQKKSAAPEAAADF